MSATDQIKAEVTDRIIQALEEGVVPWRQPWTGTDDGVHCNHLTGRPYRGVNQWLLDLTAQAKGYPVSRWLTFKQAKAASDKLGGDYCGVRKGEASQTVVFWKAFRRTDEDGNEVLGDDGTPKLAFMLRTFRVFNLGQTDLPYEPEVRPDIDPHEEADRIVAGMPQAPTIEHGGGRAFYRPAEHHVQMPPRHSFRETAGYYATLFHELTHSTGHPDLLNRNEIAEIQGKGSDSYAREELVAELGSAILTRRAGVKPDPEDVDQEAAYIAGWLRALRDDKNLLISASSRAQKAADFILSEERTEV